MQEAKLHGEKISFQDALELSMETGATKQSVTATDLYNSFYLTMNKILMDINNKQNRDKIFEKSASNKKIFIILKKLLIFIVKIY